MSVYLKIALWGTAIMLLSLFIIQINEDMQSTTIQDINTAYKANPTYGDALGSPEGSQEGNHTLVLDIPVVGVFTVPYIGEILYFISTLLNVVWIVLTTLLGLLADIATLSMKFPSFLTPVIAIGQVIVLLSWYKVLMPSGSG